MEHDVETILETLLRTKTNIDMLHYAWELREKGYIGRGDGKTFLRIHELAAGICLGMDNIFVVTVSQNEDIQHILPMMYAVFMGDYGIIIPKQMTNTLMSRRLELSVGGRKVEIVFVSERVARLQLQTGHIAFTEDHYGIVPMGRDD